VYPGALERFIIDDKSWVPSERFEIENGHHLSHDIGRYTLMGGAMDRRDRYDLVCSQPGDPYNRRSQESKRHVSNVYNDNVVRHTIVWLWQVEEPQQV
jgi:hypothetical protein